MPAWDQPQLDWHAEEAGAGFPTTPDVVFLVTHWDVIVQRTVAALAPGRLLDIGCGDARDLLALAPLGWTGFGLDPSPHQLRNAREKVRAAQGTASVVQAIGETLPFQGGKFRSVMSKSAMDHFADGEAVMREIARVLQPEGRAVVTAVKYTGLACRLSRAIYNALRLLRFKRAQRHLFWDTPLASGHHSVECTYGSMTAAGRPFMELEHCYGVSLLAGVPRWGWLLAHLPKRVARLILAALDALARRLPRLADIVVCVWRAPPDDHVLRSGETHRGG